MRKEKWLAQYAQLLSGRGRTRGQGFGLCILRVSEDTPWPAAFSPDSPGKS